MKKLLLAMMMFCTGAGVAAGQSVEVNKNNKTIAVTADETVSVDPELAFITVAYQNYGPAEKETYEQNVRQANLIVGAMLQAGVDKRFMESGSLSVKRVRIEEEWTPAEKKQRQYEASQSWTIKVPTEQAQKLVDIAMRAGANNLESVRWEVIDHGALQAKAGAAALTKARTIAEQMAQGLNTKLGNLVYASNHAPAEQSFPVYGLAALRNGLVLNTAAATIEAPSLVLFPQKVSETATVHAVFAVE